MPRNISFALTTNQIKNRTKTVTRRLGWKNLKAGDILNACVKCMGLKPGEKIERLGQIRVVSVRRESLAEMDQPSDIPWNYGTEEAKKEGFPNLSGCEFVTMFCENMGCKDTEEVTRIEFEYIDQE